MSVSTTSQSTFDRSLQPLRRRAAWIGWTISLAIVVLVITAILVAAMWFDLTFPLPASSRIWVLPASLLGSIAAGFFVWTNQRENRRDIELVRSVDSTARQSGRVMAGYDLARQSASEDATFTKSLETLAGNHANEQCRRAEPDAVLPSTGIKYWWRIVGLTMAGLLLIAMVFPRMAWTQANRILLPSDSQLPYSPSAIVVQPGDTEVLFGQDLEITAEVDGPPLENLELVLREDASDTDASDAGPPVEDVLPMLEESDGQWRTYLTRIAKPAMYFVRARGARSTEHRLEVRMTPQFQQVTCRMVAPEYTKRTPFEGPIPKRGIEGLAGTVVQFKIKSNRPLSGGRVELKLDAEQTQAIHLKPAPVSAEDPEANHRASGSFTLTSAGKYSISIRDIDGIESATQIEGAISLRDDIAPVVRLLQPNAISLATPDVNLPIVMAAEDDYGVAKLELFRGLNQSPGLPTTIPIDAIEPNVRISTTLPLAQYGLQPGDEIMLFARAEDNDPAGAKGAESPVALVRIISRQQLAEIELNRRGVEAIVSKQRRIQRMLDALRKELDTAQKAAEEASKQSSDQSSPQPPSKEKSALEEAVKNLAKALASAESAAKEASETAKQLGKNPMPVDVDREMSKRLEEMAEKLNEVAKKLEALQKKAASGEALSKEEQQQLKDLVKEMNEARQQHDQQMMQPTSDFAKTLPLAADEQRFMQLVRRQRDLATRMESLRGADLNSPDVARRADQWRREQQQLQVMLGDLIEDIESHVAALPDDPELDQLAETATQFAEALRSSEADPAMTNCQQGVLDDDGQLAAKESARAAEILESFVKQCNGMGQQACKNCKAKFNPSNGCPNPGNSIDQLLAKMGLGKGGSRPGMGAGNAAGGGYSMRQQTSQNVGVYGGLPPESSSSRRGSSESKSGGAATYSTGGPSIAGGGSSTTSTAAGARGDSTRAVPSQYRSQVSDYFRQLAEQLGDQQ